MKRALPILILILTLTLSACGPTIPVDTAAPTEDSVDYFKEYSADIINDLRRLFQDDIQFNYRDIEEQIAKDKTLLVSSLYNNTEKTGITSLEDLIKLAKAETTGSISMSHTAYDIDNKLWKVEFEGYESDPYTVIMDTDGITKAVLTQHLPINQRTLSYILKDVTLTFSLPEFVKEITIVPSPHKNTKKSSMTSSADIMDLANNEIGKTVETYTSSTISYDAQTRYWKVEFKKNGADPQGVIIDSDGITKYVYSRYMPIEDELLEKMLSVSTWKPFSYAEFKETVPKEKIIPPPYKNTKAVKFTSEYAVSTILRRNHSNGYR